MMIAASSTGTELRRFRKGLVPKLAILALVLIPLLYGALYLWAFWDPTGKLDQLPVALVNSDQGAIVDGKPLVAGDEVTNKLVSGADLGWKEVDATTAEQGVKDGTYYFAVEIPRDFSANIASAGGSAPEQAEIQVTYNDANSFLATTLGRSAMQQVQSAVREEIGQNVVGKLIVGLGNAGEGFSQASDGAISLTAASKKLSDGATTLADGTSKADAGATKLVTGLGTLSNGATKLSAGTASLEDGTTKISKNLSMLATGAGKASSGAGKLSKGSTSVDTGAKDLAQGLATLATGTKTASSSSVKLAEGAAGIDQGVDSLGTSATQLATGLSASQDSFERLLTSNISGLKKANSVLSSPDIAQLIAANEATLSSVTSKSPRTFGALVSGTEALSSQFKSSGSSSAGTSTLKDGTAALRAGAKEMSTGLSSLDSGAKRAKAGANELSRGTGSLKDGARNLAAGTKSIATGSKALDAGAGTLGKGVASLNSGAKALATGATEASSGAGKLQQGTSNLDKGATTLSDGNKQLQAGAGKLATALKEGADSIPHDSQSLQTARTAVIAAPVVVTDKDIAQASGFGEGFAPFFIALALFVGSLITWLLLRPVPPRALAAPVRGVRIAAAGYLPGLLIGLAQVAVMLAVVRFGLGMSIANGLGLIGFAALTVAAFLALQQMIIAVVGSAAGKVVILAALMLQLASSGGTYPVSTTPGFFQAIHSWMPMSYAVTGMRQLITGGADGRLVTAIVVLAGVLLGSLAITSWRAGRMRTWSLERLHPAVSL